MVDLMTVLGEINPAELDYQEWVSVGMALKQEGHDCAVWDSWSARDTGRYHPGDCEKKWRSFSGNASPVTGGTIVQIAQEHSWTPPRADCHELDWDDVISFEKTDALIDPRWVENREINVPNSDWNPAQDLVAYLTALFEPDEYIGYVTRSAEKDGRFIPASSGSYARTLKQLLKGLDTYPNDIGATFGDYNPEAGAWIRFNPLDGKGIKNDNVTDFRYCLVESDQAEIERQNAILRELELPIAALVHSGNKSLHAIVRVNAADRDEYRKRVDYIYSVCKKNGLEVDAQNRNPSRLSRMPGVIRKEQKQYLIDTNIGKASFEEWRDWYESETDDLPEPEGLADVWNSLPELSPPLIEGVLRLGHKMLLAGPSKRSMDRASGSGVFGRDPDALLDMIELETTEDILKQEQNNAACRAVCGYLRDHIRGFEDEVSQDDQCSRSVMRGHMERLLEPKEQAECVRLMEAASEVCKHRTAWRIEGNLREFPSFSPINLWFDYPIHRMDTSGCLADVDADGMAPSWQKGKDSRKKQAAAEKKSKAQALEDAVANANFGEPPTVEQLAEYLSISERTVRRKIEESKIFRFDKNTKTVLSSVTE